MTNFLPWTKIVTSQEKVDFIMGEFKHYCFPNDIIDNHGLHISLSSSGSISQVLGSKTKHTSFGDASITNKRIGLISCILWRFLAKHTTFIANIGDVYHWTMFEHLEVCTNLVVENCLIKFQWIQVELSHN